MMQRNIFHSPVIAIFSLINIALNVIVLGDLNSRLGVLFAHHFEAELHLVHVNERIVFFLIIFSSCVQKHFCDSFDHNRLLCCVSLVKLIFWLTHNLLDWRGVDDQCFFI